VPSETARTPLRVFISAGESSGDLHASRLVEELRQRTEVKVEAIGGRRLENAGARIVFPMEKLSVVGLTEGLVKLPSLVKAFFTVRGRFRRSRPHLFIPVDFPGFNIRLAGAARAAGIPVMYYIAPQIWAWGAGRIRTLKKIVDKMAVVLPFEEELYSKHGVPAEFVGHPLAGNVRPAVDRATFRVENGFGEGDPLVGLLPGSRWHEVERLLPPMLEAFKLLKRRRPECRAAVGLADEISEANVRQMAREVGLNPKVLRGRTYDLIEASDALLAASGTVTLEAALLEKPMVVVYSMSKLTFAVARRVVKTENIGLVNLVAGRRIVPEYVQDDVVPESLCGEIEDMLFNERRRAEILAGLKAVKVSLGAAGAAGRAADIALKTVGWRT
jgi:lipid-A-disaccharide synthase